MNSKTQRTRSASAPQRLMTVDEVADYLALDRYALYRMRREGTGPRCMKIGQLLRYRPADVEAWLDQRVAG